MALREGRAAQRRWALVLFVLVAACHLASGSREVLQQQQQQQQRHGAAAAASSAAAAVPAAAPPAAKSRNETANSTLHSNRTANGARAGVAQTFSTYSTELGASINGTPFVPGACGARPTALGYQCSWAAPDGVVLHWTYNTSHPPLNRCTSSGGALPANETLEASRQGGVVIHFALQAATKDKLHLAFVEPSGRYLPSEGVHGVRGCAGEACGAEAPPEVQVLFFDTPTVSSASGRVSPSNPQYMEGWAGWASADFDGLTGVLCFSRAAQSKLMRVSANLGGEAAITYGVNRRNAYTVAAPVLGMASVNFRTGTVRVADLPLGMLAVHGALMVVAFAVLLPAGLLVSRHKWLFVDQERGHGLSPWWTLTHMALLVLGASAALAGMIVALVVFGNNGTGLLMSTHQVLGLIAIGMAVLMVVMYGLRPFVTPAPGHPHPLLGPQKTAGWLTVLAGWTALFLGCWVIHNCWAVPLKLWVWPCGAICAAVAAAAAALEARLQHLVRSGTYNPKTHSMCRAAPLPLARIRTGREPAAAGAGGGKKEEQQPPSRGSARAPSGDGGGRASGGGASPGGALGARGPLGQLAAEVRTPGHSGAGSSPGTADSLHFRRGRQSTPNSHGAVSTGFPFERTISTEHV